MEETQFAKTFRKANSCDHCRKQKQKCAYTTPDAQACIKCTELGIECHVTVRQRRTVKPKRAQPSGTFAWLETKPAKTQSDKRQKVDQLIQVINSAQKELDALEPEENLCEVTTATSTNNNSSVSTPRTKSTSNYDENFVLQAVQKNLVRTKKEAIQCLSKFHNILSKTMTFDTGLEGLEIASYDGHQAILALALILAVKITTTIEDTRELRKFVDKLIIERLYVRPCSSTDLVKSLIIMNIFVQPTDEGRIPRYILMAHAAAVQLDLGNAEDIFGARSEDYHRRRYSLERCRIFMALNTAIGVIAMNTSRLAMMDLLPDNRKLHMSVMQSGEDRDQITVILEQAYMEGRKTVQMLTDEENKQHKPYELRIKTILDCSLARYGELCARADRIANTAETGHTFAGCNSVVLLNIYETALNQIIFHSGTPDTMIVEIAEKILEIGRGHIEAFVAKSAANEYLTKFNYLQPLHGLCSLIRIRILLWIKGIFNMNIPVEEAFQRVQSAWTQETQASFAMKPELETIERWASVKMQDYSCCVHIANTDEGLSQTTLMLQRILRQSYKNKCPTGADDKVKVQHLGYTVNDLFTLDSYMSSMDQVSMSTLPDLTMDESSSIEKTSPESCTGCSPIGNTNSQSGGEQPQSSKSNNAQAEKPALPENSDLEVMLREIFSELGDSIQSDVSGGYDGQP